MMDLITFVSRQYPAWMRDEVSSAVGRRLCDVQESPLAEQILAARRAAKAAAAREYRRASRLTELPHDIASRREPDALDVEALPADLRAIAIALMDGDTISGIAGRLGCSPATVYRRIAEIRAFFS